MKTNATVPPVAPKSDKAKKPAEKKAPEKSAKK